MKIEQDRHCSMCKYYQCVNFFMYCTKLQHRIKASRKNGCKFFVERGYQEINNNSNLNRNEQISNRSRD